MHSVCFHAEGSKTQVSDHMDKGMTDRRLERLKSVAAKRQTDLAVVLENVHDMHNVGAILRTCDATGIQSVYILVNDPEQDVKNFNLGKRTSSGARKWVDVYPYRDTDKCLKELKTRYERLLATGLGSGSEILYELDLTTSCALVFGNEHSGLSDQMLGAADGLFHIPQIGMTRSLNISVACAVSLYEAMRQRRLAGVIPSGEKVEDVYPAELFEEFKRRHHEGHKGRQPIWPGEEQ